MMSNAMEDSMMMVMRRSYHLMGYHGRSNCVLNGLLWIIPCLRRRILVLDWLVLRLILNWLILNGRGSIVDRSWLVMISMTRNHMVRISVMSVFAHVD